MATCGVCWRSAPLPVAQAVAGKSTSKRAGAVFREILMGDQASQFVQIQGQLTCAQGAQSNRACHPQVSLHSSRPRLVRTAELARHKEDRGIQDQKGCRQQESQIRDLDCRDRDGGEGSNCE